MGNSSYNLHKSCPHENARYQHCYALFFENRLIPPPANVTAADPTDPKQVAEAAQKSRRMIYREGKEVTDQADITLALQTLDSEHVNYACRDLWEDYKECVSKVMEEKQADYLRRKAEKQAAADAAKK
jgi:hypothetical protein